MTGKIQIPTQIKNRKIAPKFLVTPLRSRFVSRELRFRVLTKKSAAPLKSVDKIMKVEGRTTDTPTIARPNLS
jgi:hypothetical protein